MRPYGNLTIYATDQTRRQLAAIVRDKRSNRSAVIAEWAALEYAKLQARRASRKLQAAIPATQDVIRTV